MKKVQIFSTPVCKYCKLAKDYFAANNVPYEEFNVAADAARRQEMIDKSGQLGVPVIIIGDTDLVVGFNKPVIANLLGLPA
ncbi:MAG TPA: glutaredoxin domain-containing protein [Candidatus Nanoarchaeia archaeon]|nr:glutaredoxin domain-containing protein [Candidatus Nanoarchaeia archaeon]